MREKNVFLWCSFILDSLYLYWDPGLPDEQGRVQILEIHTARMREHQLLDPDVDLEELAKETKNFTGAEIEGLVRAAQSTAMDRFIKVLGRALHTLLHRARSWETNSVASLVWR